MQAQGEGCEKPLVRGEMVSSSPRRSREIEDVYLPGMELVSVDKHTIDTGDILEIGDTEVLEAFLDLDGGCTRHFSIRQSCHATKNKSHVLARPFSLSCIGSILTAKADQLSSTPSTL